MLPITIVIGKSCRLVTANVSPWFHGESLCHQRLTYIQYSRYVYETVTLPPFCTFLYCICPRCPPCSTRLVDHTSLGRAGPGPTTTVACRGRWGQVCSFYTTRRRCLGGFHARIDHAARGAAAAQLLALQGYS
jgi:hypothetical protein